MERIRGLHCNFSRYYPFWAYQYYSGGREVREVVIGLLTDEAIALPINARHSGL